ncbi:hypothetical protein Tco_1142861 [Tanacetum coccineum]
MGDENPIRTLGDYSKPSHEGYRNTIELPAGNNVVPLRSDTIRLVQNGCSFHGLRSEDPNQHLKDFLKLVDSLDLDGENRERTRLQDLTLYDNESWNDPRDFAKPVKAIALPQDVPSTSDRRLIELENQVQRLMEAHLAPTQPTQVNKITTPCEICSGPHDTQYCMEDPEQAFVEYASSRTDEAGGKWYTFKPEQNNLGDTYNPSWKSHPNLRWRQPQNSQNNFPNPPNRFQPNGSIPNRSFNNRPQNFNNQSNIEGLVSEFMASQDARLSKFEADFKRQQGANLRWRQSQNSQNNLSNPPNWFLPNGSILNRPINNRPQNFNNQSNIEGLDSEFMASQEARLSKFEADFKQQQSEMTNKINTVLKAITDRIAGTLPSNTVKNPKLGTHPVSSAQDEGKVMFIEIIQDDEPQNEDPHRVEGPTTEEPVVEYFDTSLTRDELTYHRKINPGEDANGGISNFIGRIKGMHVFIGNFTYVIDFMIVEDISSILDPRTDEVAYKMPQKIEQYDSLSDLEKEHTKSVYLRNKKDKRRGVEYVMRKILGFYKECLELGPEYLTGVDDKGEVTLYLMRRSLEVLRKFHWMILGGRFNQLSHVSSPLLSKPREY